jgi:hypothetical protein
VLDDLHALVEFAHAGCIAGDASYPRTDKLIASFSVLVRALLNTYTHNNFQFKTISRTYSMPRTTYLDQGGTTPLLRAYAIDCPRCSC